MGLIELAILFAVGSGEASSLPSTQPASVPTSVETSPAAASSPTPVITFGGYVEAYYSWNARTPSNGVNAYRGLDGRANNITLSNGVLDLKASMPGFSLRLALQAGLSPETYYAAEAYAGRDGRSGRAIE
jgi:hypothetical protein